MTDRSQVDWAAIRQAWENTDISDQELALRWGFKSGTTIRRQRSREDWKRQPAEVRERNAQRALEEFAREEHVRAVAQGTHTDAHARTHTGGGTGEKLAMAALVARTVRAREQNRVSVSSGEGGLTGAGETPIAERDPEKIIDARARATAHQIRIAQRMIETAEAFLEHLHTVAVGDLETEDVANARIRLQAVNMEKDSIATMTKSFQGLLEAGFKLMRQALGLDVVAAAAKPGDVGGGAAGGAGMATQDLVGRLSIEQLMVLRRLTIDVGRENNVPVPPHIGEKPG